MEFVDTGVAVAPGTLWTLHCTGCGMFVDWEDAVMREDLAERWNRMANDEQKARTR